MNNRAVFNDLLTRGLVQAADYPVTTFSGNLWIASTRRVPGKFFSATRKSEAVDLALQPIINEFPQKHVVYTPPARSSLLDVINSAGSITLTRAPCSTVNLLRIAKPGELFDVTISSSELTTIINFLQPIVDKAD